MRLAARALVAAGALVPLGIVSALVQAPSGSPRRVLIISSFGSRFAP